MVVELFSKLFYVVGVLMFFCMKNKLKTNMTSENLLVRNTFENCWKTVPCHFQYGNSHRLIDSFMVVFFPASHSGHCFGEGLSSTCTVCELHQGRVRKAVVFNGWNETQKRGGLFGVGLFEEWEILHKLSLPKSKLSVRENIEVERKLS